MRYRSTSFEEWLEEHRNAFANHFENKASKELAHASAPSIAASISWMRNGWPETLLSGFASTRN